MKEAASSSLLFPFQGRIQFQIKFTMCGVDLVLHKHSNKEFVGFSWQFLSNVLMVPTLPEVIWKLILTKMANTYFTAKFYHIFDIKLYFFWLIFWFFIYFLKVTQKVPNVNFNAPKLTIHFDFTSELLMMKFLFIVFWFQTSKIAVEYQKLTSGTKYLIVEVKFLT